MSLTLKSVKTPEEAETIQNEANTHFFGDNITMLEYELQFDGDSEEGMYLFNILQVKVVSSSMADSIMTMNDTGLHFIDTLYTGITYNGYFVNSDMSAQSIIGWSG